MPPDHNPTATPFPERRTSRVRVTSIAPTEPAALVRFTPELVVVAPSLTLACETFCRLFREHSGRRLPGDTPLADVGDMAIVHGCESLQRTGTLHANGVVKWHRPHA